MAEGESLTVMSYKDFLSGVKSGRKKTSISFTSRVAFKVNDFHGRLIENEGEVFSGLTGFSKSMEGSALIEHAAPSKDFFVNTSASNQKVVERKSHDQYVREFNNVASLDFLEYGSYTRCDELLDRWLSELGDELGSVVGSVFLKSLRNKKHALLLLKAVSSLPYESVEPNGPIQAMAYLPLEDDELAEAGIRAFESWDNKEGIEILEQVKMREVWLEKYRLSTIEYLKGL